jgi:hypothetical protein
MVNHYHRSLAEEPQFLGSMVKASGRLIVSCLPITSKKLDYTITTMTTDPSNDSHFCDEFAEEDNYRDQ